MEATIGSRHHTHVGKFHTNYQRCSADARSILRSLVQALSTGKQFAIVSQSSTLYVSSSNNFILLFKQLEPEYESAARSLQEYGIVLAKVDGPSEKELANSLQIVGWPTLKVF